MHNTFHFWGENKIWYVPFVFVGTLTIGLPAHQRLAQKEEKLFFDCPHPWPFFNMHVRYYMYYYSLIMQCHTSRVHAVDLHPFHWLPA